MAPSCRFTCLSLRSPSFPLSLRPAGEPDGTRSETDGDPTLRPSFTHYGRSFRSSSLSFHSRSSVRPSLTPFPRTCLRREEMSEGPRDVTRETEGRGWWRERSVRSLFARSSPSFPFTIVPPARLSTLSRSASDRYATCLRRVRSEERTGGYGGE